MAARTIEPAIGASTCAFGSHRWVVNIGNFTSIPRIIMVQKIDVSICDGIDKSVDAIIIDFEYDFTIIKVINIGKEAVIVYNIKYIPACNRSGWYPQNKIMMSVGISEASNQI